MNLLQKKDLPEFNTGDTITVFYEIREGDKVRTQFLKVLSYKLKEQVLQKPSQSEKCLGLLELKESFPSKLAINSKN